MNNAFISHRIVKHLSSSLGIFTILFRGHKLIFLIRLYRVGFCSAYYSVSASGKIRNIRVELNISIRILRNSRSGSFTDVGKTGHDKKNGHETRVVATTLVTRNSIRLFVLFFKTETKSTPHLKVSRTFPVTR